MDNRGHIVQFEWDERKSSSNLEKHGIDFEEACSLWLDPDAISLDLEHRGEKRELLIAHYAGSCWAAIYTMRGQVVRIISVRRAVKGEVSLYDKWK